MSLELNDFQQLFINVLRSAITGCPLHSEFGDPELQALLAYASQHHLLPLIFDALAPLNPSAAACFREKALGEMLTQTQKTECFSELYPIFEKNGIKAVVLKGIGCRALYHNPDLRPSGDEDILIPKNELERCISLLRSLGFTVKADDNGGASAAYRSSPLYIELHTSLFPENDAFSGFNKPFAGILDSAEIKEIFGANYYVPEPTLHLLYLILHSLKHFIFSGFGIRQLCDICLFAGENSHNINGELLLSELSRLGALPFAAAVFAAGEKYLKLSTEISEIASIHGSFDPDPLMLDLLTGGAFGSGVEARLHSGNLTLSAASGKNRGLLRALLPPKGEIEERYGYSKKFPILLPAAYISRIFSFALRKGSHKNAIGALEIGKKRIELLRFYKIID